MPCVALGYSGPVCGLIDPLPLAASTLTDDTSPGSTSISVNVNGGTINPSTHSIYMESFHTLVKGPRTATTPSTSSRLGIQTPEGKATSSYSTSRTILPSAIETPTGLEIGTQTITASFKSQNVFDSGRTLSSVLETSSAGSDFQPFSSKTTSMNGPSISVAGAESTELPAFATGSQTIESYNQNRYILGNGRTITPGFTTVLGSSTSLLSHATAAPAPASGTPIILINGGNTTTASSLGQFSFDNQYLKPDSAITASGTMISLVPNNSDVVMGTRTGGLGANFTGFASSPKTTGAQIFKGDAPGARDEVRSSSLVTLVVIALLFFLR